MMVKNHLFPWSVAIVKLEKIYPDNSYIDIGGSTTWNLSSGKTKKRRYWLLPSNTVVTVTHKNGSIVSIKEKDQGEPWYLLSGFIVLLVLFIFMVIPYYRNLLNTVKKP